YGATQLIIRVPLGVYADKKSRHRPFIVTGTLCAALASLLRILFPVELSFLAANMLSGVAASTWISFTVLNTGYYPPEQITRATSRILMANNAGTLIGFIVGALVVQVAEVPVLFMLSIGSGLLGFVLSLFIYEPALPQKASPSIKQLLSICTRRRLLLFAAAALLLQGVNMATAMSFSTQYATDIGGTTLEVGICSILYMVACISSSAFAGSRLVQKSDTRKVVGLFMGFYGLYGILTPFATRLWMLYILQFVGGFAYATPFSLFMSGAMTGVPREKKATAMGFYQAVYSIGMTFIPMLMGALVQASGMQLGYFAMAAACVLNALLVILVLSKKGAIEQ
ncbi:MAG: MFS transporter, partial [Christensenellaceae bacterium]|nr:MFS transporter [Christensenellaceae bacterium]